MYTYIGYQGTMLGLVSELSQKYSEDLGDLLGHKVVLKL